MIKEQNMFFPEIYNGREDGGYEKQANLLPEDEFVSLVQDRVQQDGQWCIDNDLVGDNADVMRAMMKWCSTPSNITQCLQSNLDLGPTVDWICRDLANAAKWIKGSRG
jgi:hypothetical protein